VKYNNIKRNLKNKVKMMDYYSDQPGPTKEAAIEELIKETGKKNEEIIREILEKETIGSWTGWYCSHKKDIKYRINLINNENS
jgi:hypothetical protein